MVTLPLCVEHCKKKALNGRLVYKNSMVDIPREKITDSFRDLFRKVVSMVGGEEPPSKVPSRGECRFCEISEVDCPERVKSDNGSKAKTDLF